MPEPTPSPEANDIAMIAALQAEADSPFGQSPTVGALLERHPALAARLAKLDPVAAASAFGSLLTLAPWQASCLSFEVLVHLALAAAQGKGKPDEAFVRASFAELGSGPCGYLEDPSEELFVGTVRSPRGNFRVLEGIWEANAFLLQRFIDVVEDMPEGSGYDEIRHTIYALLTLSDMICERSGLERHQLGGEMPVEALDKRTLGSLGAKMRRVRFSFVELEAAGIDPLLLAPFLFTSPDRALLLGQMVGASTLERRPLIRDSKSLYVVLPTAVSVAIRYFIIERMTDAGMLGALRRGIANEYARHFRGTRLLGERLGTSISFQETSYGAFAGTVLAVDKGHYLNLVFFTDHLADLANTGLAGTNPDSAKIAKAISEYIDHARTEVAKQPDFISGINFLVGCGVGRGVGLSFSSKPDPCWQVEYASAHDFDTLSWVTKFKPLSLWRLMASRGAFEALGTSLHNYNGLLNLVAWARSLDGHLVPHGNMPEEMAMDGRGAMILVNQNSQRQLRHEVAKKQDTRVVRFVDGRMIPVRRNIQSDFADDRAAPDYASEELNEEGWLRAVHLAQGRAWWGEASVPEGTSGDIAYERWRLVAMWLSRAAATLDDLGGLPAGPLHWRAEFAETPTDWDMERPRMSYDEARLAVSVEVGRSNNTIITRATKAFDLALHHEENIAERALVDALIEGCFELAGRGSAERSSYLNAIVPNPLIRQAHAFAAAGFRDFLREEVGRNVVRLDRDDEAALKIGLGWTVRDPSLGGKILGVAETTQYLNDLVASIEDSLCADLKVFDCVSLLEALILNYEAAAVDRDRWRRTSSAVLALHGDPGGTLETIAKHDFELNAVFQASRMVMEVAVCECPASGGREPGKWDLSKLMTKAALIFHLGGWSDAIRWKVMEPEIRITPLGDVHAQLDHIDEIITPHARDTSDVRVKEAADSYPDFLQQQDNGDSAKSGLEPEFAAAWLDEFGMPLDDVVVFLDWLESRALSRREPVMTMARSDFATIEADGWAVSPEVAERILDMLILPARPNWRDIPEGFTERDRHPWRYRRRLSTIRRPLLPIPSEAGERYLVAPGMVRESLLYSLSHYYRGEFPPYQLGTRMKKWAGRQADKRGAEFSRAVSDALRALGWQTMVEVKVTKILRRKLDRDYGDVDVLAWRKSDGRVLIIECKDLHFRKTPGEMCEQMADFRGEVRSGKPDLLLKHLNRMDVLRAHAAEVGAYVNAVGVPALESHLVFRYPVPMQYALARLREQVKVSLFDKLVSI